VFGSFMWLRQCTVYAGQWMHRKLLQMHCNITTQTTTATWKIKVAPFFLRYGVRWKENVIKNKQKMLSVATRQSYSVSVTTEDLHHKLCPLHR